MKLLGPIVYEISLWLLALLTLPKFLYEMLIYKKYRHSFLKRFGADLLHFEKKQKLVIWIHAVSLGETKAVVALSKELKKKYPQSTLIISSITETGHQEAKKSISGADYHLYLPFDFNFLARRIIKRFSPDLVLLSESDFWFNFLRHAKKKGASIVLVNGKISERSAQRFAKFSFFSKQLFDLFDLFCLQNSSYVHRFKKMGISSEKIVVTGNLKFDDEYPLLTDEEIIAWQKKLAIKTDSPVLTIGSTHHPEEMLLIPILQEVWKTYPDLKVLLIPRHPERYAEAGKILEKQNISWINYTELQDAKSHDARVIVLNVMGLLRIAYQLSSVSIVGGSYTPKIGGHNVLEPCWYGKPVIFGPFMHTQVEFVELVKKYECGLQVELKDLSRILIALLQNNEEKMRFGMNGIRMMQNLRGSTNRSLKLLETLIEKIIKKSTK